VHGYPSPLLIMSSIDTSQVYGTPELSYDTFFIILGGYVIILSSYVIIFGD